MLRAATTRCGWFRRIRQRGHWRVPCREPRGHRSEYRCDPSAVRRSSTCSAGSAAACRNTRGGSRWQSRTGRDSCGDQDERCRKRQRHLRARDRHASFFQRLAHDFENVARELRKFVEKQHAVVRHADFAGARDAAAADQAGVRDRVVRMAERPRGDQAAFRQAAGR